MGKNLMDSDVKAERDKKISYFKVKQKQSYEFKVAYARSRAREFVKECESHLARGVLFFERYSCYFLQLS